MHTPSPLLPVLALAFNALVWGLSWWPLRRMQAQGLHPLWATVLVFTVCTVAIACWRPRVVKEVAATPALWVLMVAAGTTNAAFNWAVSIGDVVRVVLLFYLMPLWSVLLARWLLGEKLNTLAAVRVALALAGAAIVLWPPVTQDGAAVPLWQRLPLPRDLAEWLGVLGGLTFALNNVMLRREAHRSQAGRGWAMFAGGVLVAGALAVTMTLRGEAPAPPGFGSGWPVWVLGLATVILCSNMALQFGAARLPAHVTSVVMLSEVVFASASAAALGAGQLAPAAWLGGGLILLAASLAALPGAAPAHASA